MPANNDFSAIGGSGGFMKDMVTNNNVWGLRRLKTETYSSLGTAIEDGLAYSISGEFPNVMMGDSIAVNFEFASGVLIHKIITNQNLPIKIMSGHATGVADGIFNPVNLNRCSSDISPAEAQIYSSITEVGQVMDRGHGVIYPSLKTCEGLDISVVIENTTGVTLDIYFTVVYEETSPRSPFFGLTPSTIITPTTEMSLYG